MMVVGSLPKEHTHSSVTFFCPGKESSLGSLRARMTAFGKTHLGGTGSSHAAAGGEGPAGLQAADLYLRMAQTVEVRASAVWPPHALWQPLLLLPGSVVDSSWEGAHSSGAAPTSSVCASTYTMQH